MSIFHHRMAQLTILVLVRRMKTASPPTPNWVYFSSVLCVALLSSKYRQCFSCLCLLMKRCDKMGSVPRSIKVQQREVRSLQMASLNNIKYLAYGITLQFISKLFQFPQ